VKKPLAPKEATEICALYEERVTIGKLFPTNAAYNETFESAASLSVTNGDIFDCVLAHTAKGKWIPYGPKIHTTSKSTTS